jgi:glycerate kinase
LVVVYERIGYAIELCIWMTAGWQASRDSESVMETDRAGRADAQTERGRSPVGVVHVSRHVNVLVLPAFFFLGNVGFIDHIIKRAHLVISRLIFN